MSYRVLVINPGSTSTKFAVYEDENPILVKGIEMKFRNSIIY